MDQIDIEVDLAYLVLTQGLYIPYMFIKNFALEMGVTSVNASLLISIIGITNTLARILTGLITDLPFINPLIVTTLALGKYKDKLVGYGHII